MPVESDGYLQTPFPAIAVPDADLLSHDSKMKDQAPNAATMRDMFHTNCYTSLSSIRGFLFKHRNPPLMTIDQKGLGS